MEVTTTNNNQGMLDKEQINTLPIMESRLIIVLQKSNDSNSRRKKRKSGTKYISHHSHNIGVSVLRNKERKQNKT